MNMDSDKKIKGTVKNKFKSMDEICRFFQKEDPTLAPLYCRVNLLNAILNDLGENEDDVDTEREIRAILDRWEGEFGYRFIEVLRNKTQFSLKDFGFEED